MRKQLKNKRRSCALCKPNKTGHASRWTIREKDDRRRAEKLIKEIKLNNQEIPNAVLY